MLTAGFMGVTALQPTQAGAPIQDMIATYPSMADSIYSRFGASATPSAKPVTEGYALAPMPNQDVFIPRIVGSTGPVVAPSMLGGKSNTYRGEGFMSGSTPQATQQPRRMPMPGISLKVPLN